MTSSTFLKYSVPSRSVDQSIPENARPSTSAVTPILIYRCVIRTSGKSLRQNSPSPTRMQGTNLRPSANLRPRVLNQPQQLDHSGHRQPHYIRVGPLDPGDK